MPIRSDAIDLDAFMLDSNRQSRNGSVGHAPSQPPQIDTIDTSHFADFTFPPYIEAQDNSVGGTALARADQRVDSFGRPMPLSAALNHGANTGLVQGRNSFSGALPGQIQSVSLDGSDGASPDSGRAGGSHALDGYSDEGFGISGSGGGDGSELGSKKDMGPDGQIPAWSELKTKAGKERKRLPLACIACRRKKIRCSGEKPACKHCLRSRIPCVYKVTTRKAAPRTDYMAMLDKRLKRMEERIIKIVPKEEQGDMASITRAAVKPALPGTLPIRSNPGKKRGADEAFGPELDAWAATNPLESAEGVTKSSSLLIQEAEESKLLTEGADVLPSPEIQEHLAEVFFEHLYGQTYHVLHKPSFMRKLK